MRDSSSPLGPEVMIEHVVTVPVPVRAIFEFYGVPVGFEELAARSATHSILFDSPMASCLSGLRNSLTCASRTVTLFKVRSMSSLSSSVVPCAVMLSISLL